MSEEDIKLNFITPAIQRGWKGHITMETRITAVSYTHLNGTFFTPDGRVTNDLPLRGEIYDKLKFCAVNNIPRKITNILEAVSYTHLDVYKRQAGS